MFNLHTPLLVLVKTSRSLALKPRSRDHKLRSGSAFCIYTWYLVSSSPPIVEFFRCSKPPNSPTSTFISTLCPPQPVPSKQWFSRPIVQRECATRQLFKRSASRLGTRMLFVRERQKRQAGRPWRRTGGTCRKLENTRPVAGLTFDEVHYRLIRRLGGELTFSVRSFGSSDLLQEDNGLSGAHRTYKIRA